MSIVDHRPSASKTESVIIKQTFRKNCPCSWDCCWLHCILNKPPFPIWNPDDLMAFSNLIVGMALSELASDVEIINNRAAEYIRNIPITLPCCFCNLMGMFILIGVICYLALPKPGGPVLFTCFIIALFITFCCFYVKQKLQKQCFDEIETFLANEINFKYFPRGVLWSFQDRELTNRVNQETIMIFHDLCIATFTKQDLVNGFVVVTPPKESILLISGYIREFEQQNQNDLMCRIPVEIVKYINIIYKSLEVKKQESPPDAVITINETIETN